MSTLTLTVIPGRRTIALPCGTDPEAWYDPDQEGTAKTGCARCPARDTCLTLAVEADEPWGVWGGYNPLERQRLAAGRHPQVCADCGQQCVTRASKGTRCDRCDDDPQQVDADRDTIARLAAEGVSDPDIAARLGWTVWQIKECRKRNNITSLLTNGGSFRRPPQNLSPCGTEPAYRRHLRRGEPIDEPCRAASRLRAAEKRERKKRTLADPNA